MSRDIIDLIDQAIDDHAVSFDAMRCAPEREDDELREAVMVAWFRARNGIGLTAWQATFVDDLYTRLRAGDRPTFYYVALRDA